jgi:hypothetical protein
MLKNLAETIKAYKIEENCYQGSSVSKSEMTKKETSRYDITLNMQSINLSQKKNKAYERSKSFFVDDHFHKPDLLNFSIAEDSLSQDEDSAIIESPSLENEGEILDINANTVEIVIQENDSNQLFEDAIQNEPEPESSKEDPESELFNLEESAIIRA